MNIAGTKDLLFVNYNQDYSCISVGTKSGCRIYNCDPFGKCYSKYDGGISIVEMLFCTSLAAIVGAGEQPNQSQRRLQIINTKRQSTICELNFNNSILAVKLNRRRLIVVLEEHIHIYDISNMKTLHIIETSPNPKGICALSPSSENSYIAYPASAQTGEVLIFDAVNLQAVNIIQAHKTAISCISFNTDGNMIATASDKGTVIRVFSVPKANKLHQFRRGTYPANIYSIAFNSTSTLLSVSSDSDTVHIYKLVKNLRRSSFVGYLPSAMSEMWEPVRDFAYVKLPVSGIQNICAISSGNAPQVMIATAEGYVFLYAIDLENGGECNLLRQYSILEFEQEVAAQAAAN